MFEMIVAGLGAFVGCGVALVFAWRVIKVVVKKSQESVQHD
jgi:hypothetical protein